MLAQTGGSESDVANGCPVSNTPVPCSMALQATDIFAALSHDTRIRTLMLLAEHSELCVCELTYAIGVSQPHLSRHLSHLRDLHIVAARRAGQWVFYRIHPGLSPWARAVLHETHAGQRERKPFVEDAKALSGMPKRPDAPRCD